MDAHEYSRAQQLYRELCELPPHEWETRLEGVDLSDEARSFVAGLLSDAPVPEGLQEEHLGAVGQVVLAGQATLPDEIGGYKIVEVLGRGGMGVVYRGVQEQPHREVAIKVLSLLAAGPDAVRRFEYEAEILGRLDHPSIAKVFEAHVSAGPDDVAYIVMELVDGQDLLAYCESHDLDDDQRLDLFRRVCVGVEHAHQRGVVHRDLKPANVLVSEDGRPRVLDFGIARPVDTEGLSTPGRTTAGAIVGSLPWMSPEQARGEPDKIDVRSDVYSLGVILHRLMTGQMPHDVTGLSAWEAARRVMEDDPSRIGNIRKDLRGDLEAIVAMALEKDPERRYLSAGQLARDIERFQAMLPVEARPWSGVYQLQKFARRHRTLVAAAALLLVTILVALVVGFSLWQDAEVARDVADAEALKSSQSAELARSEAERAEQEARRAEEAKFRAEASAAQAREEFLRAEREARTANEVVDFIVRMFARSGEFRPNKEQVTVREVLDMSVASIEHELLDDPLVRTRLLTVMGLSYGTLGLMNESELLADRALVLADELPDERGMAYYRALHGKAVALGQRSEYDEARALLKECVAWSSKTLGPRHASTLSTRRQLLQVLIWKPEPGVAWSERVEGELSELLTDEREVYEPGSLSLFQTLLLMADYYASQDRFEDVSELSLEAMQGIEKDRGPGVPAALRARRLLAMASRRLGNSSDANVLLSDGIRHARNTLDARHPSLLKLELDLGVQYQREGRADEAAVLLLSASDGLRDVLGDENVEAKRALYMLALVQLDQQKVEEALASFEEVLRVERASLGDDHRVTLETMTSVGSVNAMLGRFDVAEGFFVESFERRLRLLGWRHGDTAFSFSRYCTVLREIDKLEELGRLREAAREALGEDHELVQLADRLMVAPE